MEGRKRSRKNTRQEWKRRVSSALAVVLTAAMVLNTPLSIDGLGGLHISNAFASGSNAEREKKVWATASNAKYKRGESQEVDIYVIAEDNEAVPDNSTFLTLYLRNNTGQMITEGSLTFKGNHIGQKDGYFQDMGMSGTDFPAIVVEGEERETSQDGQIAPEEPSGEGMIYQEPEMEDQNQETVLLPEEEAQPDIENLPDDLETEESEEIQDDEDEDENEAYELTGIDLQPGEMREIQFEFYTDEDEDSTKAYVEFTFRGDKEDGNRVKSDSKFYYSIGLPFVDLSLEEGTKIESGVSNDMEIWMNEPTWVDANLEERIEAQEEKEAEEEYEALEEAEEEDEVIASGSNAEKNKDQSLTEGKGAGQETASPSDADREEISQEQKDQEKINQYTQEAMKISESKVSYEIEIYGAEFERFSPRKAEEAEGLGWISCVYEVANHTEPGLYYGKVRANGRWNNEKFTSEQGFFFEVTGEGKTGQEYTADLNNMTVHAYAEEGVLPENVQLKVTELSETNAETAEQFQKAVDALNQEGAAYDGMMAVDITFVDENGEEIEPEGEVQVSIEMKEGALPEGVDLSTVEVHHLKEVDEETVEVEAVADGADKTDGTVRSAEEIVTELEEAEASQEEIQAAVSEDAAAVAEFSVASFSIFTVTWSGNYGGANHSVKVRYVDTNGKEIYAANAPEVPSLSNNKWLGLTQFAVNIEGFTFQNIQLGGYNSGLSANWIMYRQSKYGSGWRYHTDQNQPSNTDNGESWGSAGETPNIYIVYELDSKEPLEAVSTVDSEALGVHMYMFDYPKQQFYGGEYGTETGSTKQGIASDTVNEYDWPEFTGTLFGKESASSAGDLWVPEEGDSFKELFGGTDHADNLSGSLNYDGEEVNHLFLQSYYDANGQFYYNSAENFASLEDDGDFTVYKQLGTPSASTDDSHYFYRRGNFLPYNDLDTDQIWNYNLYDDTGEPLTSEDERVNEPLYGVKGSVNYQFGMYIWADFYQPQGGLVESNDGQTSSDMVFEFTGDDDMWVYIDGVLVLDLGGIHDAQSGSINFATGEVKWTDTQTGADPNWEDSTLREIFEDIQGEGSTNWNNDTFVDGSYHRIQVFYMERGSGASNLKISFNLKTIPDGQLAVRKDVENYYAPQLKDIEYTMRVEVYDETQGKYVPYANKEYKYFEQETTETPLKTDGNGQFDLTYNQTAVFSGIEVGTSVRVTEVATSDAPVGAQIKEGYVMSYVVTDSSGNEIDEATTDQEAIASMPAYGSINVEVTNTATFTRPLKLVKNFSGTEGNSAPAGFEATYTLYEISDQEKIEIGSVKYSDMVSEDNSEPSYIFWLDVGKNYTIEETFSDGDNNGGTEELPWKGASIADNEISDSVYGTINKDEGIVFLDRSDLTTNDIYGNSINTITITNDYGKATKGVLTIIKNIYGLDEDEIREWVENEDRNSRLRFDVDYFESIDELIQDEKVDDKVDRNIGDWTFDVQDTLDEYGFNDGLWRGEITGYDSDDSIREDEVENYIDSSLEKIESEETPYYQYKVTIQDVDLNYWYRVWELHTTVEGYTLTSTVDEYLTDQDEESLDNALTEEEVMNETGQRGDHGGKATAFLMDADHSDVTVEFTNIYKAAVELPETGGPGLIRFKQISWILLLTAFVGVDIQMMSRKKRKSN